MNRPGFVDHVVETMRAFGAVIAKPMFGGWGLYHEGLFFALIAEDMLYLKADADNEEAFEVAGLQPFTYVTKDGERIMMGYRAAPDEALEAPEAMAEWAKRGYGAALRAAAKKKPARPRRPKDA